MALTDLTGTTWVLNNEPDLESNLFYSKSYQLSFISNNKTFSRIQYDDDRITTEYLQYVGSSDALGLNVYAYNFDGGHSEGWIDESYKIIAITGGTDATNSTLISWFEANGTLQTPTTPRKSIDLTTLSGWSALSDGSHSITIVAKADGYRDSVPSAAVSVTKQSIVAYKATITGLGNSDPTSQTYTVDSGFPTSFEEVTKDGDIFIKIPTMYRKVNTVSSNQITSFTISNAKEDDSYLPYPCFVRPDGSVMDYILIGKYMISNSSTANSVNASKASLTLTQGIALCKNKGAGYYPYDVWTQKLFQDLELAIGKKVNYNSGTTITVSKIGLNHLDQGHWVFGVIGSSGSWYACYDPDKYQALEATDSPIPQDYVQIGYVQPTTSGVEIQKLGYDESNPFFNYPTAVVSNSNYNTYYCDYYGYSSGNRPVDSYVGGSAANCGLWHCYPYREWSGTRGVRLCYRPLNENGGGRGLI